MANPFFEALTGTVDGVNSVFFFSQPYTPGTSALYLNGQLLVHSSGNPWMETNPATGEVTLIAQCVPRVGDDVAGFALDTDDSAAIVEVCNLTGSIDFVSELSGTIAPIEIQGSLTPIAAIGGTLEAQEALVGDIGAPTQISGIIEVCDG